MKRSAFSIVALAVLFIALAPQQAQAQYAYGYSEVGYDQSAHYVYGYSATWLDYYAGLYYDPEVQGILFWEYDNEIPLDEDYGYGYESIYPAEAFTFTTRYRSVTLYEEYTNHFVTPYYAYSYAYNYWYDPYGFSFFSGGDIYGGYNPWPGYFFNPNYYVSGRRRYIGRTYVTIRTPPESQCSEPGQYFDATTNTCGCSNPTVPPGTVSVKYVTETKNNGIPLAHGTAVGSLPNRNSTKITATGSPAGGTYSWSSPSGKVSLSPNSSGETLTVTALSKSDAIGDVIINLTYTVNGASATEQIKMTVQQPAEMRYVATVRNERIAPVRRTRRARLIAGWRKDIDWQVMDHLGQPMYFRMPVGDTLSNNQNDCLIGRRGIGTLLSEGKGTGEGGMWRHVYTIYSPVCLNNGNCAVTGFQRYTVNGFELSNDDKSYKYQCNGIEIEGDGSTLGSYTPPARRTTAVFTDQFFITAFDDWASDEELQSWTTRLNNAQWQGQEQMLAEARALGRSVFQSAEYTSLNRTDEEFIYDLYNAYLGRMPDQNGYNAWLSVLQSDNAQGLNGRDHLLWGFEYSTEFANIVAALEGAAPPSSCDTTEQQNCANSGGYWDEGTCSCQYPDPPPDYCYGGYYSCY